MLHSAFHRLCHDQKHVTFIEHPYIIGWIRRNEGAWLSYVQTKMSSRTGAPCPAVDVPKPGWHVRPGLCLTLEDQCIYHAVMLEALPAIRKVLSWSEGDPRCSHILAPPLNKSEWFTDDRLKWRMFQDEAKLRLQTSKHVVIADISGFYDNIDLSLLGGELQNASVDDATRATLSAFLNKWSGPRPRGIPQAHSPSHVLAELFLDPVDKGLRDSGFSHIRYNDDFRIFTENVEDARKSLLVLTRLLRARGLNLQTGKTRILDRHDAVKEIEAPTAALDTATRNLATRLKVTWSADDYNTVLAAVETATDSTSPADDDIATEAWRRYVGRGIFDKTLLHFLMTLLSKSGNAAAVQYCLDTLQERPEETRLCLRYIASVTSEKDQDATADAIIDAMAGSVRVFEYSEYELFRWLHKTGFQSERSRRQARARVAAGPASSVAWSFATAYLGVVSNQTADYSALQEGLSRAITPVDRATLAAAMSGMPKARRRAQWARMRGESHWVDWAIEGAT